MKHFSAAELSRLAGAEFNRILADDAELGRLERLKYDRPAEARLLLEVLGLGDFRIGELPVRPLTPAKWAFLWMLENPLAVGGLWSECDLSNALFVISLPDLRKLDAALWEIPALAAGYSQATGLAPDETLAELAAWKDAAFRPLELIPPMDVSTGKEVRYDAQWLTRIASVAARETGEAFDHVLFDRTLSFACSCYVNFLMRESVRPWEFTRRPDAELTGKIEQRINKLAEEYLRSR